jgi:hypothetical protein
MKIMVLEDGNLAFNGTPDEFTKSSLSAVTQLTLPSVVTHKTDSNIADPWSQTRKIENRFRLL